VLLWKKQPVRMRETRKREGFESVQRCCSQETSLFAMWLGGV
jgi:hypothetical protein